MKFDAAVIHAGDVAIVEHPTEQEVQDQPINRSAFEFHQVIDQTVSPLEVRVKKAARGVETVESECLMAGCFQAAIRIVERAISWVYRLSGVVVIADGTEPGSPFEPVWRHFTAISSCPVNALARESN